MPITGLRRDEVNGVVVREGTRAPTGTPRRLRIRVGDWESGLYFAEVRGRAGRIGYAPLVVRPPVLGGHRVAVVMPTNTWQAYNRRDADRRRARRHLVRGRHGRHRGHHPRVSRPRRPSSLQRVRPSVPALALEEREGGRCHQRSRPAHGDQRSPPASGLRPDRVPGPSRVRHRARVRRGDGLPRSRRQPHVPVSQQRLLSRGLSRRPHDARAPSGATWDGRKLRSSARSTSPTIAASAGEASSSGRRLRLTGCSRAPASSRARRSALSGSRSTGRHGLAPRYPGRRRDSEPLRSGPDRPDDLLPAPVRRPRVRGRRVHARRIGRCRVLSLGCWTTSGDTSCGSLRRPRTSLQSSRGVG